VAALAESRFVVTLTDGAIISRRPDGITERVDLADLHAIILVTTSNGPFSPDVWWFLVGQRAQSSCVFPAGAMGEAAILAFAQELPGFNNDAFIRAMSSTSNQRFLCWKKPAPSLAMQQAV
jgi:hypothetical protein